MKQPFLCRFWGCKSKWVLRLGINKVWWHWGFYCVRCKKKYEGVDYPGP